jgi:hypothetical protein
MNSVSEIFMRLSAAMRPAFILEGLSGAIALLFLIQVGRRALRHFRTRRFDALSFKMHGQWRGIVRGEIPAETWQNDSLKCDILQSILIHEIGAVTDKDRVGLQDFLRNSGLLRRGVERAYSAHGADRRRAMLALGDMRVPEAIAPLTEALDDWQLDTRLMAVRALGRTGLAEAAEPMLEAYMVGGLKVPEDPISNALVRCYKNQPEALLPYLRRSMGESRELLARVAGELATP